MAFWGCRSLTSVINRNPTPQKNTGKVFDNRILSKVTLYVPAASVAAYKKAKGWKDFGTITEYVSE
jgi:hypothetical protein